MVELADNPKLDSDCLNGFQYTTEKKPDSFVIDMEIFSNIDDNINSNSRNTRSLCRKGSSRGGGAAAGGSDTVVPAASSSPRGSSMLEKAASPPSVVAATTADHFINPKIHHQITVSTTASNMNASTEGKFAVRRNSFKRPPFSLAIEPKKIKHGDYTADIFHSCNGKIPRLNSPKCNMRNGRN